MSAHVEALAAWVVWADGSQQQFYASYDWAAPPTRHYDSVTQNPAADASTALSRGSSGPLELQACDRIEWECTISNQLDMSLDHDSTATYTGMTCDPAGVAVGAQGWTCLDARCSGPAWPWRGSSGGDVAGRVPALARRPRRMRPQRYPCRMVSSPGAEVHPPPSSPPLARSLRQTRTGCVVAARDEQALRVKCARERAIVRATEATSRRHGACKRQPPMQANDGTGRLLVVAESGSIWTSWIRTCLDQPDDAATIAQYPSEACSEFAARAIGRVAHRTTHGWVPRSAVLALDRAGGDGCLEHRVAIGQALLTSLGGRAGSELLLAGDSEFSPAARRDVFEIAQQLMASGGPADIRVRFTAHPVEGLVRRSPPLIRPLSRSKPEDATPRHGRPRHAPRNALAS